MCPEASPASHVSTFEDAMDASDDTFGTKPVPRRAVAPVTGP